jgi:hypothetical protein
VILLLYRALLVTGFCLGAVGAAGFTDPVEPLAWPFFLSGVGATVVGGLLLRREQRRRAEAESRGGEFSRAGLAAALAPIAREVVRLDDEKDAVEREEFCARIDALLVGPYFELGNRNEEYIRALGPATFARVWEGFAISERLLARAWSIATDDHFEEACAELPRARAGIVLAHEEATRGV